MLKTFRGGVHPNDMKEPTAGKAIVELDPSQENGLSCCPAYRSACKSDCRGW
ncbi:MAG: hypothetical protein V8T08_10165 [Monoglobus pectinilyticus]